MKRQSQDQDLKLVVSRMLSTLRGTMKTSHLSIQKTFGSCFHWCHILETSSSLIILPNQPQMPQCVYSFLALGGGGGPKQTDQPKSTTKKLWAGPSQEQSATGRLSVRKVPWSQSVCGHLASFTNRKAPWLL